MPEPFVIINDSKTINPAYLTRIVEIDRQYREFMGELLVFDAHDDLFHFISIHERETLVETLQTQHNKLVIQCLNTLFTMPCELVVRDDTLEALKTYIEQLNPQLFRTVIKRDDAYLMTFLLKCFSFQTTRLTSANTTSSLLSVKIEKTILEEIVSNKAIHCLRELLKQGYHLNFLTLASDGSPLASHVLSLNSLEPFQFICMREVVAFKADSFYRKLLTTLETLSAKQPCEEAIKHAQVAHSLSKRTLNPVFEKQMELLTTLSQPVQQALNRLPPRVQAKFVQVHQLVHETHEKINIFMETNPQFRHTFMNASREFYNQIEQMKEDPEEFVRSSGEDVAQVESLFDNLILNTHHLNEFLFYSLPPNPFDINPISPDARESLRNYHYQKLEEHKISLQDPREKMKKAMSLMKEVIKTAENSTNIVTAAFQAMARGEGNVATHMESIRMHGEILKIIGESAQRVPLLSENNVSESEDVTLDTLLIEDVSHDDDHADSFRLG